MSGKSLPGPYGLPVFGSLLSLVNFKERTLMEWSKLYGSVYQVKMGSWKAVALQGYEAVKEALVDKEDIFSDRPVIDVLKSYRTNNGLLFTPDNEQCKEWKKLIVESFDKVWKHIGESIITESQILVQELQKAQNQKIDIGKYLAQTSANILLQICFSKRFQYGSEHLSSIIQLVYGTPRDSRFGLMVFMPWTKILPSHRRYLEEVEDRHENLLKRLEELLRERNKNNLNISDLSSTFYDAFKNPNSSEVRYFLTVIEDMLFGGTFPSRSQLMWILLLLLKNPSYVPRVQKEIDEVFEYGKKRIEDGGEELERLHLARAVMEEGLRLRPAVPTGNFHSTKRDTIFKNFYIEKGSMVIPNIWSVHHDSKFWAPDPEEYRPERHMDEKGHFVSSGHVIPFSIGRRSCAGSKIARKLLFTTFVSLLKNFDLKIADDSTVDVEGESVALYVPPPYKLLLTNRF